MNMFNRNTFIKGNKLQSGEVEPYTSSSLNICYLLMVNHFDKKPNTEFQDLAIPFCIANATQSLNRNTDRDSTLASTCLLFSQYGYK